MRLLGAGAWAGVAVVIVSAILLSVRNGALAAPPSGPSTDLVGRAKEVVAARSGATIADLEILNSATTELAEQKRQIFGFKVIDRRSTREYLVDLASDGAEVDAAALQKSERDAKRQRLGALEEPLAAAVAAAAVNATFDVVFELEPPAWDPPPSPRGPTSDADMAAFRARVSAARAVVLAPVLRRGEAILESVGLTFREQTDAPVLQATVPAGVLKRLAGRPEFRSISSASHLAPALAVSRKVIGADGVQGRGFEGAGVQVAAVEVGGGYATANPYLAGVVQGATPYCLSQHTTEVAGVIHSSDTTQRGIAPGSTLWVGGSCNGVGFDMHNAEATAHTWGATVLNNSWGQQDLGPIQPTRDMQIDDRSEEEHVRDWRTTIVVAAGNRNGCGSTDAIVTSPAKAYNVIAAGGSDTHSTLTWGDDSMYSCSSYVDPNSNHSDRQKPEVVAPGANITTTSTTSPWFSTDSGTSLAAPMVSSEAALLQQRDSRLKTEPEAVKAIVMASALSNVDGDVRLSDKDGAGSIRVNRADDIVRAGQWNPMTHTCTDPGDRVVLTMDLSAWARTRVVIAWGEDSDDPGWPGQPNADIDLSVKDPAGTIVASSFSYDNNYEIVDFYPVTSGTYTAHAVTLRCSWNPRHLSGAWIQDPGFQPGLSRHTSGSRLDAFVLGRDLAVWQRTNTGGSWTSIWTTLGKPASGATSNPYSVWWQNNNRLDVFVQGSDGALWQKNFCFTVSGPACQTTGWQGWTSLGGVLTEGPPTAAWTSGDRIDVFVRGGVNHILWQYWDTPTGWHGWVDLGPTDGATSAPAAVWWQNNTRLDVYIRATDYTLWSRYYCTQVGSACPGLGWSDWAKVPLPAGTAGLQLGSSPAVTAPTTGDRIDVFARDTNNQMRQTYWSPATGGWTDWAVLTGATFISGPGAAWWADNTKVDVFGQGADNVLKQLSSANGIWQDVDFLP